MEAYLTRGQLYLDKGKCEQALSDFGEVQRLAPKLAAGYIGAGNCFEALGNVEKAIISYSGAMEVDGSVKGEVLFKRGKLYYNANNLELAIKDLSEYVGKVEGTNVEALLMLGRLQKKTGDANNALINFEQVIKYDKEGKATITAITKIAKIRLRQKDFYGAHHTLQRPTVPNVVSHHSKKLKNYLTLTEAVSSPYVIDSLSNKEEAEADYKAADFAFEQGEIEQIHKGASIRVLRLRLHVAARFRCKAAIDW